MLKNILFSILIPVALATSPALLAADQTGVETKPVQAIAPTALPVTEVVPQAEKTTPPVNDNHVDYRYCLELKTDREIAECRYKK